MKGGTLHLVELAGAVVFTVTGSVDSKTTSISSWRCPCLCCLQKKKKKKRLVVFRFEQGKRFCPSQPLQDGLSFSVSRYIYGLPSSKTCAAVPPHSAPPLIATPSQSPGGPGRFGSCRRTHTNKCSRSPNPPFVWGRHLHCPSRAPPPPTRARTQDRPPCNSPARPHAPRCGLDLGRPQLVLLAGRRRVYHTVRVCLRSLRVRASSPVTAAPGSGIPAHSPACVDPHGLVWATCLIGVRAQNDDSRFGQSQPPPPLPPPPPSSLISPTRPATHSPRCVSSRSIDSPG